MTSPGKVTFGNNPATSYSVNKTNFAYASGQNITGSYSPYSQLNQVPNAVTTSSYGAYQGPTSPTYKPVTNVAFGSTYESGQRVSPITSPVTASYENKNVSYAPQTTKITFGGKQFTNTYTPQTRYETSYVPASQYQTYQSYQTYQKPVEITNAQILSQPIQEQIRQEKRVQEPIKIEKKESKVQASPMRETQRKKQKKGGCPPWLWPMLGILALLVLILGLLFGLGVFGRLGGAGAAATAEGKPAETTAAVNATVTPTAVNATVTPAPVDATPTLGAVSANKTEVTPTKPSGYTITEETEITGVTQPSVTGVSQPSSNVTVSTTPVTVPSIPTTPVTVAPIDVTPATVPTATQVPVQEAYQSEDYFLQPTVVAPTPVASTTPNYYTTSPQASIRTTQPITTTPFTAQTGTTYPSMQGYGSNPRIEFVQPTTSAQ